MVLCALRRVLQPAETSLKMNAFYGILLVF